MDLKGQLQSTLGSAYTLERELGGGGMSRVFLAREHALGRQVVVKVLPPEMAVGVSSDRFKREITLAAQLQHAHIVPVLSAGDAAGAPYYTMPFVQGESLRARLTREGELPVGEAVRLLRDVARALSYAHRHGVVHRDIKPENILLADDTAVVADFGVAKAIVAAAGGEPASPRDGDGAGGSSGALTSLGIALGTPQYMAPEQAAADPSVDHRADLYAFGCVAYEMLAGRTPFGPRPVQALLAAHLAEAPPPLAVMRPAVPGGLAALVMRCLEKRPADRPQSAADVLHELDALATPSGGTVSAMAARSAPAGRSRLTLGTALAIYGAAVLVVGGAAKLAVGAIGLPEWVVPGALVVMALGLPVLLATGLVQHRGPDALRATAEHAITPGGTLTRARASVGARAIAAAHPHLTWRRALAGGGAALGLFALAVAAYMGMRERGIGPFGSLIGRGTLRERAEVLVADFGSPANDSTLGAVVTTSLRTDLGESPAIRVVQQAALTDALARMQRPATTRIDLGVAREIAARQGFEAVLEGEVRSVGAGYLLSARLVSAEGQELVALRETAGDASALLPAIDRLSKRLRARVGESLKSVNDSPPLFQVTTSSLPALRKLVEADNAWFRDGDFTKAVALYEQAIALDTTFAWAYASLSQALFNMQGQPARQVQMLQRAYDLRERLPERERERVIASYFGRGGPAYDPQKALALRGAMLARDSTDRPLLNEMALTYADIREFERARALFGRAYALGAQSPVSYTNLARTQITLGDWAGARATIDSMARVYPKHPRYRNVQYWAAFSAGRFDSAAAYAKSLFDERRTDPAVRAYTAYQLSRVSYVRGRLAEAARWSREGIAADRQRGANGAALSAQLSEALAAVWFLGDSARALAIADSALASMPLDSLHPIDRPYESLATVYALAGRPGPAKAALAAGERARGSAVRGLGQARAAAEGEIALTERRWDDALAAFRRADQGICAVCGMPNIARVHDLAGRADSAIAVLERFVGTPDGWTPEFAYARFLAGSHKRLGELYEARSRPGDREKAAGHYARFVDLWKDADAPLQPAVREARRKLAELQRAEGGRGR